VIAGFGLLAVLTALSFLTVGNQLPDRSGPDVAFVPPGGGQAKVPPMPQVIVDGGAPAAGVAGLPAWRVARIDLPAAPAAPPEKKDPTGGADPAAAGLQVGRPGEPPGGRETFGTAVAFARNPREAARAAAAEGRLTFLLHVSGDFEEARFT
jgi:hypothetical protein